MQRNSCKLQGSPAMEITVIRPGCNNTETAPTLTKLEKQIVKIAAPITA
jgi:hypothetical protein